MATLTDVAKRAKVSAPLVSRVLNNKMVMPIPQATIERIRQAAEELGYRPNALARALITGRTHTLGLFYGVMTDPHFSRMLEAVEARASALGYHLLVSSNLESLIEGGRVDGALVVGLPSEPALAPLLDCKPMVFVSPSQAALPNCVVWNDVEGIAMAVRYLVDLGHRHIAGLFGTEEEIEKLPDKATGFRQAVAEAKLRGDLCCGDYSPDRIENGYHRTRELLRQAERPTAIVARNDYFAVGAMKALYEAGIAVPQEVSVVGYTDTLLARCASPQLTSVRTPFAEAGVMALEKLIEQIETDGAPFPGITLPLALTERDSCAPPKNNAE